MGLYSTGQVLRSATLDAVIQGGVQYKHKFEINIPPNKDAAKWAALEESADIVVYTDRSKINGKVGAAATVLENGQPKLVLQYHLGNSKHYSILEAELVGEILAVHCDDDGHQYSP
jgi:hypothetical protein